MCKITCLCTKRWICWVHECAKLVHTEWVFSLVWVCGKAAYCSHIQNSAKGQVKKNLWLLVSATRQRVIWDFGTSHAEISAARNKCAALNYTAFKCTNVSVRFGTQPRSLCAPPAKSCNGTIDFSLCLMLTGPLMSSTVSLPFVCLIV